MKIKLVSQKPKKYAIEMTNASQLKELCKFVRKQKDKQLEIVINGKSTKFNSVSGRQRFISGFEHAFKVSAGQVNLIINTLNERCNSLSNQITTAQQESKAAKDKFNEATKKYVTKHTVMKLRKSAWEDYISELKDDREILKAELDKFKKKAVRPKKKRSRK